jgi:hypothetical protein
MERPASDGAFILTSQTRRGMVASEQQAGGNGACPDAGLGNARIPVVNFGRLFELTSAGLVTPEFHVPKGH